MNYASTTLTFDAESYYNSDCRKVSFYKIFSSIEWIYPHGRFLGIESFKQFTLNLVNSVSLPQTVFDKVFSLGLVLV